MSGIDLSWGQISAELDHYRRLFPAPSARLASPPEGIPWTPTMRLRLLQITPVEAKLQQEWVAYNGQTEWRDVPKVPVESLEAVG